MRSLPPATRQALDLILALVVGAAAFGLSALVEAPGTSGFSFGRTFQEMSAAPFARGGIFPHRVLLPAIAHWLGLDGARFYLAAHGASVLLLALVFWAGRRLGASVLDAALVTLALGFSAVSQVYKSHVGYPDSLAFALLLGAVLAVRSATGTWLLVLLGGLAHEMVFFFVPFVAWLRLHVGGSTWRREALFGGGALGLYLLFRLWVRAGSDAAALAPTAYFGNGYFPLGFLGVLYLAVLHVAILFGPLLLPLAYAHGTRYSDVGVGAGTSPRWQRTAFWLLLLGIVGIYAVAHDFNRFANFLFLPLLFALREFLRLPRARVVVLLMIGWLAFATACVLPPVAQHLFAIMAECNCLVGVPSELTKLVTYVLPRAWPLVLAGPVFLAAVVLPGVLLARRSARFGQAEPGRA